MKTNTQKKQRHALEMSLLEDFNVELLSNVSNNLPSFKVDIADLIPILNYLKKQSPVKYEMLFDISAIDESKRSEKGYCVFYHLISLTANRDICIRVYLNDDSEKVPSITAIWPSANWYEREIWDMFGLTFSGHPNLTRLLMPEYWQGHPLRKDYPFHATKMPAPFDLDSEDYANIMESYQIPDHRQADEEDTMLLNIGPNHPGTHGIIRLMTKLRGETLLEITPEIGYHHRGVEKLAERHTYHNYIPYTDRVDYLGGVAGELPYLLAIEQLIDSHVPERATVIRVLLTEFFRLSSHLVWVGSFGHDLGAISPAFYCFKVREEIFDFIELVTGARMHPAFFRVGGVSQDMPEGWQALAYKACDSMAQCLPELEKLTIKNRIFQNRTRDIGIISQEQAIDWGFTGPNLRASGLEWDLRRTRPYCNYDSYDFNIPTAQHNDCFSRIDIRLQEITETLKIIKQAIDKLIHMPTGPVQDMECNDYAFPRKQNTLQDIETLIHHFIDTGRGFNMPKGETFFATETSKGMTGYHLFSEGQSSPYRLRVRTPSIPHFQSVKAVCEGEQVGNLVAYISSIDYVLSDLDR
ncbi:NADH dehydrogenase (quinone) subunit D [uncultured Shewanella sp.]|uniref:NADH dehydrogenase (quinone) subunit D n=1 Tax=uncultured Shewanella sp. TaxID=173975 RepID=UPI00261513D3|nr:NADH dehydrogenase (quinone) subunit D [uncultured Shewanella sp.]